MLVSLNWVREFVDFECDHPQHFAHRFTMTTAEAEGVYRVGEHLPQIIAARIKECALLPSSSSLKLVKLDLGQNKEATVVCGAPNARPGLISWYAPPGTVLPNGSVIELKEFAGHSSSGMLCSEAELEIGENHAGIAELPPETPPGQNLASYLGLHPDVIMEVDNKSITHRPDLWGHLGIAREFSTIFRRALKDPFSYKWSCHIKARFSKEPSPIIPYVEPDCACLGYYGITIENVKVAPSPPWLRARLQWLGMRPINNIVDISNYVMLELGIPLHIFDKDKIKGGRILVKALREKADLKMLDGSIAKLMPGDTVVADAVAPLVAAGIMGGEESGVSADTHTVFVETANWRAGPIRRTSMRLGLRTDSSMRYEKSLDSLLLERTALRAVDLILQLCPQARIVGKLEYAGPPLEAIKQVCIQTSFERINRLLGKEVAPAEVKAILEFLDFKVEEDHGRINITVPSYRATKDVEYEADIVEEVGRVVGYNTIIPQAPLNEVKPVRLSNTLLLQRRIKEFMVLNGRLSEIMTYPLVGKDLLEKSYWPQDNAELKLANAWSAEFDRMRPSLIPSLLQAAALNQKNFDRFGFFELGRAYLPDTVDFSREKTQLGCVLFDREASRFIDLLELMERLLAYLRLPGWKIGVGGGDNKVLPHFWKGVHPTQYQEISINSSPCGAVTCVGPAILREFKMRGALSLALLDLSSFEQLEIVDQRVFTPISRFPITTFDCTVWVPPKVPAGHLIDVLERAGWEEFLGVKISAIFQTPDGRRAVSLRSRLGSPHGTLSAARIKELEEGILSTLKNAGYPLKEA